MNWTTVTNPQLGSRKKRRTVNVNHGDQDWGGSFESHNMLFKMYRGKYDRIERYRMYDWMDRDSDISRALDLIAEHCTEQNPEDNYFNFNWYTNPTEEESTLITENMVQWSRINEWDNRLFRTVRNVVKYGDWFFFRNPDTFELYTVHPKHVVGACSQS